MNTVDLLNKELIRKCKGNTEQFAKNISNDKSMSLIKLEGDASTRSYFRFSNSNDSIIIMKLNLSSKLPEEGFTGKAKKQDDRKLPFVDVYNYLSQFDISIPQIFEYAPDVGVLLLEDVGDELLQYYIKDKDNREIERIYTKALDSLIEFQKEPKNGEDCIAFKRSFDVSLLNWEFEHFIEYALTKVPEDALQKLRQVFDYISKILAGERQIFVHRDYHSRNILVKGDKLYIIDFQDALLGPIQYDLASLLKDAYIHLDEKIIERLISYFMEKKKIQNREDFVRHFDYMTLQRNLKAIGRFHFIDRVKNNSKFLQYIPNLISNIKPILKKYKELQPIDEIFSKDYEDYVR